MKKLLSISLLSLFLITTLLNIADAAVYVRGYTRKDGTYVQPHYRSNPDGNPYNNWSYPGNTNPYTDKVASGNPDTYLRNYYDRTPSVPSYSSYVLPNSSSYSSSPAQNYSSTNIVLIKPIKTIPRNIRVGADYNTHLTCEQLFVGKEREICLEYRNNINNYDWQLTDEDLNQSSQPANPTSIQQQSAFSPSLTERERKVQLLRQQINDLLEQIRLLQGELTKI